MTAVCDIDSSQFKQPYNRAYVIECVRQVGLGANAAVVSNILWFVRFFRLN